MRVLIDECLPRKLKYELPEHEAKTVPETGWSGKKNGELLRLIAGQFDAFITIDQSIKHQQNLENLPFAVVTLSARSNRLADLLPLVPKLEAVLLSLQAGQVIRITAEENG
ncbi:MAG: DUF5615 family PIN-like protein [Chloroflexi bacterium]|nr:DUF5615 family PIN-like protein [Chloroflexota bacterium]